MKIQYVSKYIAFSEEGLVPILDCPMDQGPLFCNQSLDEEIFLYCLDCDYKKIIGTSFYHELVKKVNGIINGN